ECERLVGGVEGQRAADGEPDPFLCRARHEIALLAAGEGQEGTQARRADVQHHLPRLASAGGELLEHQGAQRANVVRLPGELVRPRGAQRPPPPVAVRALGLRAPAPALRADAYLPELESLHARASYRPVRVRSTAATAAPDSRAAGSHREAPAGAPDLPPCRATLCPTTDGNAPHCGDQRSHGVRIPMTDADGPSRTTRVGASRCSRC